MYFYSKNSGEDFEMVVRRNRHKFKTGVVHGFTGTPEEMFNLVKMGIYIGIGGSSMKTEELC